MADNACDKAIENTYSAFETLATKTDLDVWQNIDQAAKATVVHKTVKEYFQ